MLARDGVPAVPEVLVALASLYTDQLRPFGRILRKRLMERAETEGRCLKDLDLSRLKAVCEGCSWLRVQPEDGGEWSVLHKALEQRFVDVYSAVDCYPQAMWQAAAQYFDALEGESTVLPGGRYACAQLLAARALAFLEGRTLGEISHIIQLAISQKKILGYLNGNVVPYRHSHSMAKERLARQRLPKEPEATSGSFASWAAIRASLAELIAGLEPGQDTVPLSNLKRIFFTRFNLDLSETRLGHSKISELLKDSRVSDLCSVRLQLHGYVLLPNRGAALAALAATSSTPQAAREGRPAPSIPAPIAEEHSEHVCDTSCEVGEPAPALEAESSQKAMFWHRRPQLQPLSLEEECPAAAPSLELGRDSFSGMTPLSTQRYSTMQTLFPPTPSAFSPLAQFANGFPTLLGRGLPAPAQKAVHFAGGPSLAACRPN